MSRQIAEKYLVSLSMLEKLLSKVRKGKSPYFRMLHNKHLQPVLYHGQKTRNLFQVDTTKENAISLALGISGAPGQQHKENNLGI